MKRVPTGGTRIFVYTNKESEHDILMAEQKAAAKLGINRGYG